MGVPAGRISDMHTCAMVTGVVPHVGGPVILGCVNVLVGKVPAARASDMITCVGPPDAIAAGSPTVLINKLPAARVMDTTSHGGQLVMGCPTVFIG